MSKIETTVKPFEPSIEDLREAIIALADAIRASEPLGLNPTALRAVLAAYSLMGVPL